MRFYFPYVETEEDAKSESQSNSKKKGNQKKKEQIEEEEKKVSSRIGGISNLQENEEGSDEESVEDETPGPA